MGDVAGRKAETRAIRGVPPKPRGHGLRRKRIAQPDAVEMTMASGQAGHGATDIIGAIDHFDFGPCIEPGDDPVVIDDKAGGVALANIGEHTKQVMRAQADEIGHGEDLAAKG